MIEDRFFVGSHLEIDRPEFLEALMESKQTTVESLMVQSRWTMNASFDDPPARFEFLNSKNECKASTPTSPPNPQILQLLRGILHSPDDDPFSAAFTFVCRPLPSFSNRVSRPKASSIVVADHYLNIDCISQ